CCHHAGRAVPKRGGCFEPVADFFQRGFPAEITRRLEYLADLVRTRTGLLQKVQPGLLDLHFFGADTDHRMGRTNEHAARRWGWKRNILQLEAAVLVLRDLFHDAWLSGHEHNYDDVRGEGFFGQTRRERRAYPSGVCKERATKSGRKRTAARRVAPNLAYGCVARRSQIHFGICSRLAPCPRPNSAQR